jgi:hypothetical protein
MKLEDDVTSKYRAMTTLSLTPLGPTGHDGTHRPTNKPIYFCIRGKNNISVRYKLIKLRVGAEKNKPTVPLRVVRGN